MREIRHTIDINAPPAAVWRVLTEFSRYPEWSPLIRSIEGEAAIGRHLRVELQLGSGRPIVIRPTVCVVRECEELAWRGRLLLPGLFDGEHRFILVRADSGWCRFVHRERFTGVFVPLLWGVIGRKTSEGFAKFNEALKRRTEGLS